MSEEQPPYFITTRTEVVTEYRYNPEYGDDRVCKCGHKYYRHFDGYEGWAPVGCKYCACGTFVEAIPGEPYVEPDNRWHPTEQPD